MHGLLLFSLTVIAVTVTSFTLTRCMKCVKVVHGTRVSHSTIQSHRRIRNELTSRCRREDLFRGRCLRVMNKPSSVHIIIEAFINDNTPFEACVSLGECIPSESNPFYGIPHNYTTTSTESSVELTTTESSRESSDTDSEQIKEEIYRKPLNKLPEPEFQRNDIFDDKASTTSHHAPFKRSNDLSSSHSIGYQSYFLTTVLLRHL